MSGARPDVSDAAERVYGALAAYQGGDAQNGWVLLHMCEGTARMLDKCEAALRQDDEGSGWRRMLDPDRAPAWALPWLSQFSGLAVFPVGLGESAQRALVRDAPGMSRGSPQAIAAAAQAYLTGTRTVILRERTDPDNPGDQPYHLTVYTYTRETPDSARVLAALQAAKPAGLILHYAMISGQTIGELEDAYVGRTIGYMEADFGTVSDLEEGT